MLYIRLTRVEITEESLADTIICTSNIKLYSRYHLSLYMSQCRVAVLFDIVVMETIALVYLLKVSGYSLVMKLE